jgi:hypothetical protein
VSTTPRRPMTVSPLWLQSAVLTLIIGFAVLGYAAVRTFRESAPVPARIVDERGRTLLDREDIVQGQEHFAIVVIRLRLRPVPRDTDGSSLQAALFTEVTPSAATDKA